VWLGISVEIMALIWAPQLTVANSSMFPVVLLPSRKSRFPRFCVRVQFTTKYNLNAFFSPPLDRCGDFVAGLLYALANVCVCYPRRQKYKGIGPRVVL